MGFSVATSKKIIPPSKPKNEDLRRTKVFEAALIGQESISGDYSDLALFKQLLLEGSGLDASARRSGFEQLSAAGNPLRLLAQEQLALLDLQENDETAAVKRLRDLLQDAEMTQNLRQRLGQLMVALGQDPNALDG